jgi:hypothetical protein
MGHSHIPARRKLLIPNLAVFTGRTPVLFPENFACKRDKGDLSESRVKLNPEKCQLFEKGSTVTWVHCVNRGDNRRHRKVESLMAMSDSEE